MKQHGGNSKPPPARSASFARGRVHCLSSSSEHSALSNMLPIETPDSLMTSPEHSGDVSPCYGEKNSPKITSKDVGDCLAGWMAYLQMLNGLCGAGARLTHTLGSLLPPDSQSMCGNRATQCKLAWDDLTKVVASASNNIHAHVVQALQELGTDQMQSSSLSPNSNDSNQAVTPTQQAVICHSLMTLISLQYQFCLACCECFGVMAPCHCCLESDVNQPRGHEPDCIVTTLQQSFSRIYIPPFPPPTSRSPSLFPLWPLQSLQRRWSEAAAREASAGDTLSAEDGAMRRWSMPWDTTGQGEQQGQWTGRLYPHDKLTVPGTGTATSQERSRSTTPESLWHTSMASQEELSDVISLLSCRPNQPLQLHHPSHHLPGVTLTGCGQNSTSPSHQPSWTGPMTGVNCSDDRLTMRRGSNSPIHPAGLGRLSPHQQHTLVTSSIQHHHHAPHPTIWSDGAAAHGHPPEVSRKSSSSTDSSSLSSSLSLQSKSTSGSETAVEGRSNLYSMWSGADLPFIKLPENSETPSEIQARSSPRGSPNSQRFVPCSSAPKYCGQDP